MYSDSDLESAVEAGAISAETASALRDHVSGLRHNPAVDEEHFRLVSGFNDIFVAVAGVLMLYGGGWVGGYVSPWLGGFAVAGIAWGMAEYFTRVRRMALPSILFMIAFSGGVMGGIAGLLTGDSSISLNDKTGALVAAIAAVITTGATWLHWRRFQVPITIAVLTTAGVGTIFALVIALVAPSLPVPPDQWLPWLTFAAGLIVFGLAMKWDSADTLRQTRKADVAFWLHLLAAPMIVHPLFVQLNIWEGDPNGLEIAAVLAIYMLLALIALLIDRRALMVSGLIYVLTALMQLFSEFGSLGLNIGMAAFVIGSALLLLSAFWHDARAKVLAIAPAGWRNWLPAPALSQQPAS
jgi:hypothetical protein